MGRFMPRSVAGSAVTLQAFFHARQLSGRRFRLETGFPFLRRHAVNQGTGFRFVACKARLTNPVGQAIAAETGQPHQIDVLRVMPVPQVPHQPAEGGSSHFIRQAIKRIGCLSHHLSLCCRHALQ